MLILSHCIFRNFKLCRLAPVKNFSFKMRFNYPKARKVEDVVEELHGRKIADPYRWLEDPDSPETVRFVEQQNAVSRPFLDAYPARDRVKARLTELWNYPRYSCPRKHGDKYFFFMNTGLQNQSVLYVQNSLNAEPTVFLDPNLLSEDGTIALCSSSFSEDGKTFAYSLSKAGSDWVTIHFRDVDTGKDYPDVLKNVKFSPLAWTHDNKGLFYARFPESSTKADGTETESNLDQKLFYHVLNTSQSEDIMVVEFPDNPRWLMHVDVSDDGEYLFVMPQEGCKDNLLYCTRLADLPAGKITGRLELTQLVHKMEAEYQYVTNNGRIVFLRTNKDAPNYQLVAMNLDRPEPRHWRSVLRGQEKDVLDWVAPIAGDKMVVCYIRDVTSHLVLCDLETGSQLSALPLSLGTVTQFSGKRRYSEMFYLFTSFLTPAVIYHCDLSAGSPVTKVLRNTELKGFDASPFLATQKFYSSKDGARIPMFLVHRKDLVKNGSSPCLLYGYGGFNISIQPTFRVPRLVFLQHFGGVLAIPNIRGGGEYGEAWHNGGRFHNKQNVFDDFQSAAEYLIAEGYTSPNKLVIQGGSNGGLLVGACINQRPDLFGAAIAEVGVFDMLRFHKFTIGHAWTTDYGCSDDVEHFETLIKYSPLHNVHVAEDDVQYPATLLLTGDHDDRVVPLHSLKFIATLQATLGHVEKQTNPLMIYVDTKSGHGAGKPMSKVIEETTDILSFIGHALELEFRV
ncbi:prolyl endopeptidase [Bacillus rossius redtenbacheri]|uniref:prolyl endopeptidase n=1 Tax=Bacillus rossius redtenbacheri TaxID=93214 RepID=UPI002FDDD11A